MGLVSPRVARGCMPAHKTEYYKLFYPLWVGLKRARGKRRSLSSTTAARHAMDYVFFDRDGLFATRRVFLFYRDGLLLLVRQGPHILAAYSHAHTQNRERAKGHL